MESIKQFLFELCGIPAVSGDERELCEFVKNRLAPFCEVRIDSFNNLFAYSKGFRNNGEQILLDAHLDRIGFIVTEISDDGFLKVDKVGGIDYRTVLDAHVLVHGKKNLHGIVCCMPPHLSDGNEDKAVSPDKVWIDLGLEAEKVKDVVSVGDTASFFTEPKELLGSKITSGGLDNRAGVCAMVMAFEKIIKKSPNSNVALLLSCQEETFASGAKTGSFDFDGGECLCSDVSFAFQPGIDDQYSRIKLGKGPMICISPNMSRDMSDNLIAICEDKGIPYQLEICSGKTGTNADHIAVSKSGKRCALISVPQKNMHTQAEIVSLEDIKNTVKLVEAYVLRKDV